MTTYQQNKFPGFRTSFTITSDDVIVYEKKTLFSYSKELIPLVFFSPDVKVATQKLPKFAKWLFNFMGVAYSAMLIAIINNQEFAAIFDLPVTFSFMAVTIISAIIYYKVTVKPKLRFYHYNNDDISIPFDFYEHDKSQDDFAGEFSHAVRNARIAYDQRNFQILHKGIDSLEKQQIISANFADELHHRVMHLTSTKI